MMRIWSALILAIASMILETAVAESGPGENIVVRGRTSATITTSHIRLGDIADIAMPSVKQDEAVIGLKKIVITQSPAPGKSMSISGEEIVNRLRADGVNLAQVGYVFPLEVNVTRAGRKLMEHEAWNAIDQLLDERQRDVTIKEIVVPPDALVAPNVKEVKAIDIQTSKAGHLSARIAATSDDGDSREVTVQARVEEYKEIPIAARGILRGHVVEPGDVVMARLNVAALPRDISDDSSRIIGLQTNADIPPGEVFRAKSLEVPMVVTSGQRITLMVRSGGLEVTASGEALESGAMGQAIKVRNVDSKRTVVGTIIDSGLVEVRP